MPPQNPISLVQRHSIEAKDIVSCVQFSPFEWCQDLLAFECHQRVFVAEISFNDDPDVDQHFIHEFIHIFVVGFKCTTISFSPKTNFEILKKCVKLAVGTFDNSIVLLSSNLKSPEQSKVHTLYGHNDFINDLVFEPQTGEVMASVGDDCTCCIWSLANQDNKLLTKLRLTSPGMSVKWHHKDDNKLFIAEKKGLIRFYNLQSQTPIISFDANKYPLLCGDWCPNDSLQIGCVAGNEVMLWDTSISSQPVQKRKSHLQIGQKFAFFNDSLIATRGQPNNVVRVENVKNNQVLIDEVIKAGNGLSWNCKQPILAVGGNKQIHVFKFTTFL